jgi:hypothetical protein
MTTEMRAARAMGWASIGIALAEIVAPRFLQRQMGVAGHRSLLRALGLRELLSGIVLLSGAGRVGLWSRVAGDAMDVGLLGTAARRTARPGGLAIISAMVLGIGALDLLFAQRAERAEKASVRGVTRRLASAGRRLVGAR